MTFRILNFKFILIALMFFQSFLIANTTNNLGEYKRSIFFTTLYFATLETDIEKISEPISPEKIVDSKNKIPVKLTIENTTSYKIEKKEKETMAKTLRDAFGLPKNNANIIYDESENKIVIIDENNNFFTQDYIHDIKLYIKTINEIRTKREIGDKTVLKTDTEGKGKIIFIPKDECSPNDEKEDIFKTDFIHKIIYTFIKKDAVPEGKHEALTANFEKFNKLLDTKLASSFSPDNL